MDLLLTLLYSLTFLSALFGMFTLYIAYVHWKFAHIPSPRMPSFYAGHLPDILRMSKGTDELASMTAVVDYWLQGVSSRTFIIFLITKPELFTVNPEVIKEITMNTKNSKTKRFVEIAYGIFGNRLLGNGLVSVRTFDEWKPQRKLFDPAFSKVFMKTLSATFSEMTNVALDELKPLADGKTTVPLKKHVMKLATDIISKVAFSTDFSKIWTAESLGIKMPQDCQLTIFSYLINKSLEGMQKNLLSAYPALNQYLHPLERRKYKKVVLALRKIGRDCIMKRIQMIQNGEEAPKDILTLMLSSEREDVGIEELVDNFITFYVAGQETTAHLIMFSIILLTQHPNVLESVLKEVNEVLGDKTVLTGEDIDHLPYMEQVLYESLRLYPPAFGILKNLHSDNKLEGYLIPAGTDVMLMGANMNRMSEFFENPDDFNPDRFHVNKQKPSSFVFFPFGLGHRSCIGKTFAIMEAKTVLARLLKTFSVHFPHDYKIQTIQKATLQPKDNLLCTLTVNDE